MPKVVFQLLYDLMLYPDCQLFDPAQAKEAYEAYENFLALENGDGWESWDEEFEEIATLFHIYLVDNQSPDPGHLFDLPSELSVYSVLRSITWTTGAISMRFRDLQNHSLLILDNCCGSSAYTAQEGDEVFLLKGLNVPVVLRPNGENYSFVGPCSYIHGVMEGQKWPEDESELQDLVLV
ncbi:hypothetical protein EAE99_012258 [Botrytis elliptica]|nr:hypothetical protein EAE99_012258 [Botrytis elliptica]